MGRKLRGLDHISPTLDGILERHGLRQGVVDHGVRNGWREIVGAHLASRTEPLRIHNGVLWVFVENSALLQHLTFYAGRMLRRVHEVVPGTSVERIRFTLRKQEPDS